MKMPRDHCAPNPDCQAADQLLFSNGTKKIIHSSKPRLMGTTPALAVLHRVRVRDPATVISFMSSIETTTNSLAFSFHA
jgi:hypothetical protein